MSLRGGIADAVALALALMVLAACGARTPLDAAVRANDDDAGTDASVPSCTPAGASDEASLSPDPFEDDAPDVDASCDIDADPSADAVTAYGPLGEGLNSQCGADDTCSTFGSTAFEFVPQHDLRVSRVELHATGGTVGVLDSDCGQPGAALFGAALEARGSAPGWQGATVSPPLRLTAGHLYFVYESPDPSRIGFEGACSTPTRECGLPVREFTGPVGGTTGPWRGPYTGLWLTRFTGVCP